MKIKKFKNYIKPTKFLYLHGIGATPESDNFEQFNSDDTLIYIPCLLYEDHPVFNELCNLIEQNNFDGIVGHSVGGYLAFYLSNKYNVPCLMFNPAFNDPDLNMQPIPDDVKNIKSHSNQMAIIGLKDDEVSPEDQIAGLKDSDCDIFIEKIGHDITDEIKIKYFNKFLFGIKII